MKSAPLPLRRHPLVETRSLEEARRLQSTINSPVEVDRTDRSLPFRWQANRVAIDGVGVVASRYLGGVRARAANVHDQYSLMISRRGGTRARQAGGEVRVVVGRAAALVSPSSPAEFELDSGYEGIQLSIPARTVASALEALTGSARGEPLRFDLGVDLTTGAGPEIVRLVEFMMENAERELTILASPIVQGRLADALVHAMILGLPHNHSHRLRTPAREAEPPYVRRAEEFLDAHADRRVSMIDLARVTGVSARTLFAGFRAHRGRSPMAFLRERRFELARRRLLAAATGTVTDVATSCGFEHLGRFSAGYRARFGESPAETMRRR